MQTTKTEAEQILALELKNVNAIGVRIQQIAADLLVNAAVNRWQRGCSTPDLADELYEIAWGMFITQAQDGKQQPQYLGMLQHIDRLETLAGMLTETVDRLRAEARAVAEEA